MEKNRKNLKLKEDDFTLNDLYELQKYTICNGLKREEMKNIIMQILKYVKTKNNINNNTENMIKKRYENKINNDEKFLNEINTIYKDHTRCKFNQWKNIESIRNKNKMTLNSFLSHSNSFFTSRYSYISYYQGFLDFFSFFCILFCEEKKKSEKATDYFSNIFLMDLLKPFKGDFRNDNRMADTINLLNDIINIVDKDTSNYLKENDIELSIKLSWINTLFCHDIDFDTALRIFSFLLFMPPICVFVLSALIIKEELLIFKSSKDYNINFLEHLQNRRLEKNNIEPLLKETYDVYNNNKYYIGKVQDKYKYIFEVWGNKYNLGIESIIRNNNNIKKNNNFIYWTLIFVVLMFMYEWLFKI